ncbi:adenosylcobalamin-dependent ribonucleoside-diphosphate reductase [Streptomyces sp. RB6PN25]|uniref:Vitamin B12-dependent ribonucleotide reductase n=1 Tax=Streptomyces humicola TaxID=2953240 RepID=A0ABT1Q1S3_9ACTN|nr:adenosylcobalamin-dependent ribonucleoside-diphosphate reductase [Streptomyces humicola]MCQ4083882.1 adenosylcobalamin-dependent ribonucleoside-diphosphate reductase [Streptomyces humicola]
MVRRQQKTITKPKGHSWSEAATPPRLRQRDGAIVGFDPGRIEAAISRAACEVGRRDPSLPATVTAAISTELARRFGSRPPGVEDIQDAVEQALMRGGFADVARAFIVYRREHAELRRAKLLLGVRDDLKLPLSAVAVLKERYLLRDDHGRVAESTGEMMDRVARHVAQAEEAWSPGSAQRWVEAFSRSLRRLEFLPNSPTLMNAGTSLGLLSGCVVLPLEDSLVSIFGTLGHAALLHQAGAGTGYSFSRLRPRGDAVASTGGAASGPVSFLSVFDAAADVLAQGGRRRGASMAVLDVSHPDIVDFVQAKAAGGLEHFNVSVAVSDRFMRAVLRGTGHRLVNPRTGKAVARIDATELFDRICRAAWRSGDPGLLFLDRINQANPLPSSGRIEATNPCGEVPLLPYESCNLASLNLARFISGGQVDFERLRAAVWLAVRFLDDVIDVSRYPIRELERPAHDSRKVGLGVMGLAELLAVLGIPYDSEPAIRLAGRVLAVIEKEAHQASAELAAQRGPFPLYQHSRYAGQGTRPLRNAQLTSIAPTGTISLIAGTTSGIEPMFALSYVRHILGRQLPEVNPHFERLARDRGFWSDQLRAELDRTGMVRQIPHVPPDVRTAFVTALEIPPEWHLKMQAAVQRHVDAAVAKTINLPEQATAADIRAIYLAAWQARVKGITVYRYGARPGQVLTLADPGTAPGATVKIHDEYSGGCSGHTCAF